MPDQPGTTGIVVAAHGRRGILESGPARRPYVVRGRSLRVVCGDRVCYEQPAGSEAALVTRILPRQSTLARQRPGREPEPLAANLTRLVVVCAPVPEPDLFLVDRFLCAAELMGCRAAVAWNKCDLRSADASIADYAQLGYPVVAVSARSGLGLEALSALLDGHVSVLAGQSGVGKSSLVNALVPGGAATVGELSAATTTGTHTTTTVVMYPVGRSSRLLDTPGVRDFIPAIGRDARVATGFPEIRAAAAACRFANCEHVHEPGCAVKDAAARADISAPRYRSYLRLREMASGAATRATS
jgi:ribosome biogenesis GTPase